MFRFIPAFAGTTSAGRVPVRVVPVHPRVRGDHPVPERLALRSVGSSPRSRGPRRCGIAHGADDRFIPAFAGTTRTRSARRRSLPVHPRVRGDHHPAALHDTTHLGSSPRSRGPRLSSSRETPAWWFIPAFAGTTRTCHAVRGRGTVHPRVRGDHVANLKRAVATIGSSPRSRGPQCCSGLVHVALRFIPAFAGTTRRCAAARPRSSVHPRVRGDHTAMKHRASDEFGSSPRSRGPLRVGPEQPRRARFIPAFAGTTRSPRTGGHSSTVHPRVRGDHCTRVEEKR